MLSRYGMHKLADPEYTLQRQKEETEFEQNRDKDGGVSSKWEPQAQPAVLGNTISPMLSNRSNFNGCITQLQVNHKEFLKTYDQQQRLSLKFPAICAEIKLDGERMVVHATREGIVTIQTRNAKWYSQIYSPGLAPCIRKALQKYPRLDVILDGEIESWDNGRQELIPFGNNRTVANCRKGYLARHLLLDKRDLNLHADAPTDSSIMRATDEFKFQTQSAAKIREADEDPGKECWLQFVCFDVLYVGGPDANKLFHDCGFSDNKTVSKHEGSITHLPLLQRKKILYRLIDEQPKEVELCQAMIIRPNGDVVGGREYFRTEDPLMELGHQMTTIDSTQATISGEIPNLDDMDRRRRQGKTNIEFSRNRAQAVDDFYSKVVEENRFEGLVFKDLAAPYLFGEQGRKRKFWHKFKPDYEKKEAVDIDVVIVGAYFATGLRHSGKLSSFLCACLDSEDSTTYLTLCNVNGASVNYDKLNNILEATGFVRAQNGEETQLGKWFQQEDGEDPVPAFISSRSLQRGKDDYDGWKFNRSKNYPDLWIHPDDSVVLNIYGQELVQSEEYSAGISLRFSRISKIRLASVDGDEKKASEVDNDQDLWRVYVETLRQRQGCSSAPQDSAAGNASGGTARRFLTPEEHGRNPKKRKRKAPLSPCKQVPKVESKESDALDELSFTVLEGNYSLEDSSLEAQEAREDGWYEDAAKVRKKEDVMEHILLHGGSIKVSAENGDSHILGGVASDARVVQLMKGIEYAKSQVVDKPKTKKAIRLNALASNDGVLKWTFVFSLVHQRRKHQRLGESEDAARGSKQSASVLEATNGKVVPKAHHYLARTKAKERVADEIQNLDNTADTTKAELIMALLDIESREASEGNEPIEWQSREVCELSTGERCILSFHDNPFWHHRVGELESESHGCIIYPDVFTDGFGIENGRDNVDNIATELDSERWQDLANETPHHILAILPIARAMGALVTTHLHSGVTHVVCDLKERKEPILSFRSATLHHFKQPERGEKILDYLISNHFENDVRLVHPEWVKDIWSKGMDDEM
jgi:ATP-dependent DNA ligase